MRGKIVDCVVVRIWDEVRAKYDEELRKKDEELLI